MSLTAPEWFVFYHEGIWNILVFSKEIYNIVSMLLIWSLVSLFDQLPEVYVMMRWQGWESGTYPLNLCCMWLAGWWVSADESQYWKFLVSYGKWMTEYLTCFKASSTQEPCQNRVGFMLFLFDVWQENVFNETMTWGQQTDTLTETKLLWRNNTNQQLWH